MRSIPLLLLAFVVGCGGSDRPPTHAVSGYVKLDSKPVADANVAFHPSEQGVGVPAYGITNAEGYYELTTFNSSDGAVAAQYKVTVSKQSEEDALAGEIDLDDPGDAYEMMGDSEVKTSDELPAKYASPETTPETRTVAEGANEFNFDLTP